MNEQQAPSMDTGKKRFCEKVSNYLSRLFARTNRPWPCTPRREEEPSCEKGPIQHWQIIFQSLVVGLFIGFVLLAAYLVGVSFSEETLENAFSAIVVASLASSALLTFILPWKLKTARLNRLICGHVIATGVGYGCYCLIVRPIGGDPGLWLVLSGFVAVCLATYSMTVLGVPHPPAAGTALGFAIAASYPKLMFIVVGVLLLGLAKCVFSRFPASLREELG
uniref:HPP family protein n=1 Tax=Candidatus Kentrum sp. MB TaxID=2138164 RepID=A0A451BG80_9GAMM|nr:MAG: HPP family protein [Candidatus Kentron sp. MB]VFK35422.1 MAG: HPP family protein [Candidatus Kentron sp. MB]VFK77283.1 MAG: HPP family protein [Candidatus Kentron sp. MB]